MLSVVIRQKNLRAEQIVSDNRIFLKNLKTFANRHRASRVPKLYLACNMMILIMKLNLDATIASRIILQKSLLALFQLTIMLNKTLFAHT